MTVTEQEEKMASAGSDLARIKSIEARIDTLYNEDLREICRAYGQQVSGNKAVLQKRCKKGKSVASHRERRLDLRAPVTFTTND